MVAIFVFRAICSVMDGVIVLMAVISGHVPPNPVNMFFTCYGVVLESCLVFCNLIPRNFGRRKKYNSVLTISKPVFCVPMNLFFVSL